MDEKLRSELATLAAQRDWLSRQRPEQTPPEQTPPEQTPPEQTPPQPSFWKRLKAKLTRKR